MRNPPQSRRLLAPRRLSSMVLGLAALLGPLGFGLASTSSPAAASAPSRVVRQTTGTSACSPAQHIPSSMTFPADSWMECVDGAIAQSSPAVATYNGETIVAVGDENGYLHVINAATGQELPGWPERVTARAGAAAAIESSPAIGYLNGPNAAPSIVVGTGSTWVSTTVAEVEAFSLAGAPEWTFKVGKAAGTAAGVISSPAIGPVTGAGMNVVFGSWDHKIYVLNANGTLAGFAYDNADTIWSSPALYKLPGHATDDVFLGSDASGRPYAAANGTPSKCVGGFVDDYRWSNASIDPDTLAKGPGLTRVWLDCLNQSIWSSPAIGLLSGSTPAVIVGTGYFEQPFPSDTDRIYAFNAITGKPLPHWPVRTPGPTYGSPAVGPINTSGTNAVVDVSWDCTGTTESSCFTGRSVVVAYSATGARLWKQVLLGQTPLGSPILAPLQGEASNDVIVGTPNALYPLDGATGSLLFGTNSSNQFAGINNACRVFNTPAVADVQGTGPGAGWHLIDACGGPAAFHQPGEIASYPLPTAPTTTPAWPMFRQSPDHLGVAVGT